MAAILENELWKKVVDNMPIPAIDFLLFSKTKGLLMGKRINKPARNFYFVPGGRVFKNETRNTAIKRISSKEIGKSINLEDCFSLGIYDHFYNESIWENTNITTHYIVEALLIILDSNEFKFNIDSQHSESVWIDESNVNKLNVHKYSKKYLTDILNI